MRLIRRAWAWLEGVASDPRKLLLVDVALVVAVAGLAVAFVLIALQTHDALCSFRADLETRVEASARFLADHPNLKSFRFGPVIVTRSQLVTQAASQRATLRSLDDLNC